MSPSHPNKETTVPTSTDSFKVSVDGEVVEVDPSDFDRFEWRDLKTLVGMTQVELFAALAALDLDVIAGMLWLVLRRDRPDLAADDVNLRLSDMYDQEEADAGPPG